MQERSIKVQLYLSLMLGSAKKSFVKYDTLILIKPVGDKPTSFALLRRSYLF